MRPKTFALLALLVFLNAFLGVWAWRQHQYRVASYQGDIRLLTSDGNLVTNANPLPTH